MTAAAFPRPFARLTRRPTAERSRAAAGHGDSASPACPPAVRDRGRPQRPPAPTSSAARPRPRTLPRGPQPDSGPLHRPGTVRARIAAPAPAGGGRGASMSSPAPIAVRSSGSAPHSSHWRIPGTSSAPPAATSSRIRSPRTATGEPGASRRSAARPASVGTSSTSKRSPTKSRTGSPGTVGHPSSFSYQPRIRSAGSSGSSGRRGRGTVRIAAAAEQTADGTEPTMPSATVEKARELRWVFERMRRVSTNRACGGVGTSKVVRP